MADRIRLRVTILPVSVAAAPQDGGGQRNERPPSGEEAENLPGAQRGNAPVEEPWERVDGDSESGVQPLGGTGGTEVRTPTRHLYFYGYLLQDAKQNQKPRRQQARQVGSRGLKKAGYRKGGPQPTLGRSPGMCLPQIVSSS